MKKSQVFLKNMIYFCYSFFVSFAKFYSIFLLNKRNLFEIIVNYNF